MTRNEKCRLQKVSRLHDLHRQLGEIPDLSLKLLFVVLYLAGAVFVATRQAAWRTLAGSIELLSPAFRTAMEHALPAYLLIAGIALLVLLLYPFGKRMTKEQLQSIGLTNHAGIPPELLRKRRDRDNPRVTVWEFRNNSISLQEWEKRQAAIETALGLTIVKLAYAKGKSRVLVYAVPAGEDLPETLKWHDRYLSTDSFVLTLGESYTGPVTVNLAHIPHILLGGSTGSGKSVLLKLPLRAVWTSRRSGVKLHASKRTMKRGKVRSMKFLRIIFGCPEGTRKWRIKCLLCVCITNVPDVLQRGRSALHARPACDGVGIPKNSVQGAKLSQH